jgi:hypothetical protein
VSGEPTRSLRWAWVAAALASAGCGAAPPDGPIASAPSEPCAWREVLDASVGVCLPAGVELREIAGLPSGWTELHATLQPGASFAIARRPAGARDFDRIVDVLERAGTDVTVERDETAVRDGRPARHFRMRVVTQHGRAWEERGGTAVHMPERTSVETRDFLSWTLGATAIEAAYWAEADVPDPVRRKLVALQASVHLRAR